MKKMLSREAIKYIAVFAMLLDHIAWVFLPFPSFAAQLFHTVGRITAPVMCFFIAQGYAHTKSLKKYALRLFIFALLSQIPWWLMKGGGVTLSFNMLFTLLLSLLAIHAEAKAGTSAEKLLYIGLCCLLSIYCDWSCFAVLWSVGFYKFRDNERQSSLWLCAAGAGYVIENLLMSYSASGYFLLSLLSSLFTLGVFLALPLLLSYNGQRGGDKFSKWVFYLFYPLHMLVLALVKNIL